MGKDLFLKKPGVIRNPVDAFRKKMKMKEKIKKKEKKDMREKLAEQVGKAPSLDTPEAHLQNLGFQNFYSSKKNQIASINPDLLDENFDSIQTILSKKNLDLASEFKKLPESTQVADPPKKDISTTGHVPFTNLNAQTNERNKKNEKNNMRNQKNDKQPKHDKFQNTNDPFFLVTTSENYTPINRKSKETPVRPPQPPQMGKYANLHNLDNYYQREANGNPENEGESREQIQNPFLIQKEAELKGRSKIDVSKNKALFMPSSLKNKDTTQNSGSSSNLLLNKLANFKNVTNVPTPVNFSRNLNLEIESSENKLKSFLSEIEDL